MNFGCEVKMWTLKVKFKILTSVQRRYSTRSLHNIHQVYVRAVLIDVVIFIQIFYLYHYPSGHRSQLAARNSPTPAKCSRSHIMFPLPSSLIAVRIRLIARL